MIIILIESIYSNKYKGTKSTSRPDPFYQPNAPFYSNQYNNTALYAQPSPVNHAQDPQHPSLLETPKMHLKIPQNTSSYPNTRLPKSHPTSKQPPSPASSS